MAAFTRLDGVPAIPLGDQAGAPLDMGVVMPPLLPGKLSLEHRAMPPPSDVLPDAFDTASPLMSSGPITVPPAQDLAAPADDMAPAALARSLFPDPDLAMRAPAAVARIETAPPTGNGTDRQAVEKALIGPAVTKAKPAFHPAAPVPMAGFPSVGMTLTPAPTAMVKGEAPMPVPFPVDAPKAAGLAVVDIGNPPTTKPKLPITPIGPLPTIMVDQGDTALPNLPVRPPTQDNLIQVSSGPPCCPSMRHCPRTRARPGWRRNPCRRLCPEAWRWLRHCKLSPPRFLTMGSRLPQRSLQQIARDRPLRNCCTWRRRCHPRHPCHSATRPNPTRRW